MELKGKKAVVTGVSKGIGHAVVNKLLQKGAIVCGMGLHTPPIEHEAFHFVQTDVRELTSVEKAFTERKSIHGEELHILINNSGLGYFGFFEDMTPEQMKELYAVNVFGIYHTCRYAIPVMKSALSGHIINISSIAGLEGMAQGAGYCGAKHAVRGITESLYKELREFGIKVTGIYPGSTNTDFFNNAPGIKAHDNMMAPEEVAEQMIRALETSDNFLMNEMVFRPLQPKPKKD